MPDDAPSGFRHLQTRLFEKILTFDPVFGARRNARVTMLRAAFFANPRHRFVGRFLKPDGSNAVLDASSAEGLEYAYRNSALMYVDERGQRLPASNSEPGFILHLLALLGIEPGDIVLEVGAGRGWLLAMIASLVGDRGRAVGIEINESLANAAIDNLVAADIRNARIRCADGFYLPDDAQAFDRIIFTAATYEFPHSAFHALREGGRVVLPLDTRLGSTLAIVFEKSGGELRANEARLCRFVPLRREGGSAPSTLCEPAPDRPDCVTAPVPWERLRRHATPFSDLFRHERQSAWGFLEYLGRKLPICWQRPLAPAERAWLAEHRGRDRPDDVPASRVVVAGVDPNRLTYLVDGESFSTRDDLANDDIIEQWQHWQAAGRPSPIDFELIVRPTDALAPPPAGYLQDTRKDFDLYWR